MRVELKHRESLVRVASGMSQYGGSRQTVLTTEHYHKLAFIDQSIHCAPQLSKRLLRAAVW
jgi:hypothetical protein